MSAGGSPYIRQGATHPQRGDVLRPDGLCNSCPGRTSGPSAR